jgi:hypothetical protein
MTVKIDVRKLLSAGQAIAYNNAHCILISLSLSLSLSLTHTHTHTLATCPHPEKSFCMKHSAQANRLTAHITKDSRNRITSLQAI